MTQIPFVTVFNKIPPDTLCQEASPQSGHRYIACGAPAVAIVARENRAYAMCKSCAVRAARDNGAAMIYSTDASLKKMMKNRTIKTTTHPDPREAASLGRQQSIAEPVPPGGSGTFEVPDIDPEDKDTE